MKAIHADPKEIRKIFSDSYLIPDFQRPYSWEEEQCETLWDDIVNFHATSPADKECYFLGNIIVNPADGGKFSVVDGQQRLTTLLLLIKALFKSAGTYPELEKCLRVLDKRTGALTNELRVKSEVLEDDATTLQSIIFDTLKSNDNSKLAINFRYFIEVIEKWRKENSNSAEALLNLIDTFLDKIVLLPIECDSDDDALTIFQTINNRGMLLTDADIFKAKLYHSVPAKERSIFIEDWKQLGGSENTERLFRILMHVLRAKNGITDKEIGLRAFFTQNKSEYFADWLSIVVSLKKINAAGEAWSQTPENVGILDSLWAALETYPNLYWNYPLYVFLHKYGELTSDGEFFLSQKNCNELEVLFIKMIKYFFIKGMVYNSVNAVKDITFKVCAAISAGREYRTEFDASITDEDKKRASEMLKDGRIGSRYLRGLVVLASYLNPRQDKTKFSEMLWTRYDVEHILPKEWNHYDGWTAETYEACLNLIGNLMPLERAKNIKAQNEYLRKKKLVYADSCVQDAREILAISDNGWTPDAVQKNHAEKVSRLGDFFDLK